MTLKLVSIAFSGCLILSASSAIADEGLAGFQRLDGNKDAVVEDKATFDQRWAAVDSPKLSLVNLAPALLAYFNNAPVYGLPGTVTGSLWERTQVTGDWGGLRTDLAHKGLFFDLYTTSTYQNITNGGLKEGGSFVSNSQLSINVDTGRAGLWDGGLLHVTLQSRHGYSAEDTLTSGASVPTYTGLAVPGPLLDHHILPSEYYIAQALGQHVAVVGGKISDIFIPDQTLFADSYKYYFANFNFNKSPITPNFYNPTAWAALGIYSPTDWLALAGGVLDPNSQSDNFADDAFKDVNVYLMALASYELAGLPGQFAPAYNWTSKDKLNLGSPFGALAPTEIPHAVETLLGGATAEGLPARYKDDSWFAIANFSQYLWVKDNALSIKDRLKGGQVIDGIGLFGRVGYAPEETNPVTRYASLGIFGHGLLDARPYDSFGVGGYYNRISPSLKKSVSKLTAGTASIDDEKGMEVFYSFAVTPATRLIGSYQHIWDPFAAQVATRQDKTDIFMLRMTTAW